MSDWERRFAVVLEKDKTVLKWFKPGKGVFPIRYTTPTTTANPILSLRTRDGEVSLRTEA